MSAEPTIRRGVRNSGYAVVPNHVFEDTRMSMEARWLLGYLLSKPDNWIVVVADIMNKGGCGRDKVRKMIAELERLGYAEREQVREGGKFGASVLVIFDVPRAVEAPANQGETASVAFLPQTDLPATVMPSPVSPSPVKTAHSNNSYLENTDHQKEREGACEVLDGKGQEGSEPAETPKQIEAAFVRLVSNWKESKHRGLDLARKRWQALTPDDRRQALEKYPAWREAIGGDKIKNPPQYSTYIGEKLWLTIPEPPPAPKPTHDLAGPWGRLWMGTFLADTARKAYGQLTALTAMQRHQIDTGYLSFDDVMREKRRQLGWPKANRMLELAEVRKGCVCALELVEPSASFQAVNRDGEVYAAWVGEFQRRGIPWASGKPAEWLYFPPLPDGLPLAEAVSAALDAYVTTISEIIQRSETDAAA